MRHCITVFLNPDIVLSAFYENDWLYPLYVHLDSHL